MNVGFEELDLLVLRLGGESRLRVRRPGGEDHPGDYRRQQNRHDRQSAFSHLGSPSSFGELPDVRSARGWGLTALSCARIRPWSALRSTGLVEAELFLPHDWHDS